MKRCQHGFHQCALHILLPLLAVLLWWETGHTAQAAHFIDYLYVEANEGDSSGGHVALRFDDETFHFQHETPGILRVRRLASAAFDHVYAMLGNRTILESKIAVTDETYALLRGAFIRLYLVQEAQLATHEALRRDVTLFKLLLRQNRAWPNDGHTIPLTLKGLGYFFADAPSHDGGPQVNTEARFSDIRSPALLLLLNRIHTVHGKEFVTKRRALARRAIREMALQAAEPSVATISPDAYPTFTSPSARYEDALLVLYALDILQAAPSLRQGTFRTSNAAAFRLEPTDSLALQAFAGRLEGDLVALVNSSRTDWGLPFVVGMARLAAIEASLASGRLVFLDIFATTEQLSPREHAALRPYLPSMSQEKETIFLRRREEFFSGGRMREADYAALERTGNLLLDIDQSRVSGNALRKDVATFFPSREAHLNVPVPSHLDSDYLMGQLVGAQAVEQDYTAALERLYAYDLVKRNCVTELFAVINHTLAQHVSDRKEAETVNATDTSTAVKRESEQRLGGYIDASGLSFIPFVSAGEVASTYAVIDSRERQSYRKLRLMKMNRREAPLTVALRESNTITSTIYRPGPDDSKFLFFTEDTLLLRPLFGVVNLLVGFGESLVGIATMPVEGPDRFISGTKGVFFSIPELVFVNLRKGSMAYVEQPAE
ncbi:MAG TPA: hypothetical protein VIU41_03340 [Geobacteraceae bacterium]